MEEIVKEQQTEIKENLTVENFERKIFLKEFFEPLSSKKLGGIIELLIEIKTEKEQKEREAEIKNSIEKKKLVSVLEIIQANGVDISELSEILQGDIQSHLKNYKYEYLDERGVTKYWSGQGKMPAALKKQIEQGKTKEDFLRSRI